VKKKLLVSSVGCALAGLVLLGQVATAADLKVGIMVPTTGSEANYGKDMENAINLAAGEINKAGGVMGMQIVTSTVDDACDPQQASAAANKLVSADVTAVVGGYCSGATLPTMKIYGDAKVPFVIVSANSTKLIDVNQGNAGNPRLFLVLAHSFHAGCDHFLVYRRCFDALRLMVFHVMWGLSR